MRTYFILVPFFFLSCLFLALVFLYLLLTFPSFRSLSLSLSHTLFFFKRSYTIRSYIVTNRGMHAMYEKFRAATFGRCPQVFCQGQPVLPVGLSDLPRGYSVNVFCPRCHGLFFPRSTRQANIDGAYFGTTFPHLYLMTHAVGLVLLLLYFCKAFSTYHLTKLFFLSFVYKFFLFRISSPRSQFNIIYLEFMDSEFILLAYTLGIDARKNNKKRKSSSVQEG